MNEIINTDLKVNESFVTRLKPDKLYNTDKLPDDTWEDIRIIEK